MADKYCRLSELLIPGGSMQIEEFLHDIDDLCYFLQKRAPKLTNLHLPIASNSCLKSISAMAELQYLVIDRSKHLNFQGLAHLSHPGSCSKYYLKVFHLGIKYLIQAIFPDRFHF